MKKYESVFFRHREMNGSEYLEVDGCGLTESAGPVIVLTIEEAEAIFSAGFNRGVEAKTNGVGSKKKIVCPDFKTYLQDKEIPAGSLER